MTHIRDGDLYKIIRIEDISFEIRYGYYEEYERGRSEPVPVYPDLLSSPVFIKDGRPLVTAMQNVCEGFEGEDRELGCFACRHFCECEDLVGLCNLESKRRRE